MLTVDRKYMITLGYSNGMEVLHSQNKFHHSVNLKHAVEVFFCLEFVCKNKFKRFQASNCIYFVWKQTKPPLN